MQIDKNILLTILFVHTFSKLIQNSEWLTNTAIVITRPAEAKLVASYFPQFVNRHMHQHDIGSFDQFRTNDPTKCLFNCTKSKVKSQRWSQDIPWSSSMLHDIAVVFWKHIGPWPQYGSKSLYKHSFIFHVAMLHQNWQSQIIDII